MTHALKHPRVGWAFVLSLAVVSLASLAGLVCLAAPAAKNSGGYHLLKKVSFDRSPGDVEYFDYINFDTQARRVFMCEGTRFLVADPDGKMIGSIGAGDLKRCHGVAFVPQLNRGFITDGTAAKVLMFDLKTFKVLSMIPVQEDADYILYEPVSKRVFAFNGTANSISVIDPVKGAVIKTIPVGGQPEQAVADGKGMIYDTVTNTNELIALDARTLAIKSRWPVAPAGRPTSIAMDKAHRRLFISGRGPKMLVVMDADTGKIIGPGFPIGENVDTNVFDPKTKMLAVATRQGILHIFHEDSPDKLAKVQEVTTEFGAKTMGWDPKTHDLYLTTSDFMPQLAPLTIQPTPAPVAKPGTFRLLIYGR